MMPIQLIRTDLNARFLFLFWIYHLSRLLLWIHEGLYLCNESSLSHNGTGAILNMIF